MFANAKAYSRINIFLFLLGISVFRFDYPTKRFVCTLRHFLFAIILLTVYLWFTVVVMVNRTRVDAPLFTDESSLNSISQLLLDIALIYAFPTLILTSLISGPAQANYYNELIRFDLRFGTTHDVQRSVRKFWMECIAWHCYYNFFVNPLDSYLYDLLTVELQLFFWAYTISAIGMGTFVSYVTMASGMHFNRIHTLTANLRIDMKTKINVDDDRLGKTFGMLIDLFSIREDFQDGFGLPLQCLLQMTLIFSLFHMYFTFLLASQSGWAISGLLDYFIYCFPIQLRVVCMVRKINGFGCEVNLYF